MRKRLLIIPLLVCIFVLFGCNETNNTNDSSGIEVENHITEEVNLTVTDSSIPVEIIFVNLAGIDIGMLSIIDPASHEQINVAALENGTSMSIGANWPETETILNWALYNKNGELCIEGSSDLTGIKESATIALSGEENVTDINVQVN